MNLSLAANILGILSLIASLIAISPTLINLFKFSWKNKRAIWQITRIGVLATVCLGLIHGLLMTQQEEAINFYKMKTYWVYAGGLFAFNLFAFWAFMFAELKSDTKRLNYLTYGALFLLACHVGQQIIPVF